MSSTRMVDMGRMVRKQIYLDARQDQALQAKALARGVSVAELIRRAIDGQMRSDTGLPPSQDAWAAARDIMLQLREGHQGRKSVPWSREALYAERMDSDDARTD